MICVLSFNKLFIPVYVCILCLSLEVVTDCEHAKHRIHCCNYLPCLFIMDVNDMRA